MKKKIFITVSLTLFVGMFLFSFSVIPSDNAGQFKYVGVSKCGTCHKSDAAGKQLDIWQNSKHANAWKTLESPEADKVAKDKGFTTKASETPACIKCHVLGKDLDPSEFTESFDKTQGVQCESCHGAGSEYKAMSIMKDKAKAIENGMIVGAGETLCTGCHNDQSPSFKGFKYDEMWAKIKHAKGN
jgi:excinuclease UvrABC ATPase subunit